ncbi:uncharacterized protein LOC111790725 [Cucurbita pepo subsp. pepo]|uniref:uncharacterized protein LOC111790725 n=1 Tax=Cucurbita pepo subsp. pepo TaxID=3664 RepID=UPI000C9D5635|nr:uncharacterized protein LOC111790725 [Cucurbita pepo subsp. pepo]
MAFGPVLDYSKTHRIVLLVDLNPLHHLQNPSPYLTSITSTAKILLSFPPFSSSTLFSFRFFFSSLSPLLSSSRLSLIPSCSLSLSFDHPTATFNSLSHAIDSLLKLHQFPLFDASEPMHSQASCLAASMRQLLHDYAWDSVMEDLEHSTPSECFDCIGVKKNLVVLFSPVSELVGCLSGFLGVAMDDECVRNLDLFSRRFCGLFESVNAAFSQKDIQFSWINVNHESTENTINNDELNVKFGFLKSGIRNLGWGFCSSNSIVLGSALLPFGLIYPKLGMPLRNLDIHKFRKNIKARLCLEILDRSEKPLECKFCNLELIDWKTLLENRSDDPLLVPGGLKIRSDGYEQRKVSLFGDGAVKLHVKAVQKCTELVRYMGHLSYPFLVLEFSEVPVKSIQGNNGKFFADEVLEMMALELGDCRMSKPIPFFQLLMSFLYGEGYWALVSISNANGDSQLGILKPFMVSSALLFVIDKEFYPLVLEPTNEDKRLEEVGTEKGNNTYKRGGDLNKSCNVVDSEASPSVKCSQDGNGKMKAEKKTRHSIQNFTWADFYKAAFEHVKIELENAYFDRYCNSSKKMKFFRSWVKQIKKSTLCELLLPEKLQLKRDILDKKDDISKQLHQETKEPMTSSGQENSLAEASKTLAEATIDHHLETSEDFFNNLSSKIQQGLESEVVDLGALAERLVSSAIYWLSQKYEVQGTSDDQPNARKFDSSISCAIATKLNKLLLREPEDLATKPKIDGLPFEECSPRSTGQTSDSIVREHELQIFFRMEILRSLIIFNISESMKQKFVKDICLHLESIQCHLEGGFFGEWSIKHYVGKIIKSRYCQSLGDVVNKIYEKMDLLLFVDENKSTNHSLHSEDSNNSWRDNLVSDEVGDNYSSNDPVSGENRENKMRGNDNEKPPGINNGYTSKLIKAQEMRERARRFSSFTSWVPDLHRVWAPKQTKTRKPKTNHLKKESKRKHPNRESNDMVCETPEKRHSVQSANRDDNEEAVNNGNRLCRSVSKALFNDIDS